MTRGAAAATARARTGIVANLVWIDAREAIVLEWRNGAATTQRFVSDVPGHHHSTGHVRHDPSPGSGGGGPPRTAGETHRIEHLHRFVEDVAGAVPAVGDTLVLGPGTVRERLADRLRSLDVRHERVRVVCQPSGPRTEPQLVARLRELAGSPPRRRVRSNASGVPPVGLRASGSPARAGRRGSVRIGRRRPPIEPDIESDIEEDIEQDLEQDAAEDIAPEPPAGAPDASDATSQKDPGSA